MRRLLFAASAATVAVLGWMSLGHARTTDDDPATPAPTQAPAGTKNYMPPAGGAAAEYPGGKLPDRSTLPDSFRYYGPNGLWNSWDADQKIGRNTWIFYTGGNQKFYRILARFGGESGVSIDFFRLLDSKGRADRFREIGLINEPNFRPAKDGETDEYGFRVDVWEGDPYGGYDEANGAYVAGPKASAPQAATYGGAYPINPKWYGEPTGIIGLRKFPNPDFSDAMKTAWKKEPQASVRNYFKSPGKVEPPYVVGITCALCHIAFDPLNPPKDTAKPRWENLAANIGNQYFREGDLFFGAGRIVGGDANPGANYKDGDGDPYDTKGLGPNSFLYQYAHTQQPGTSETSRFSYDFINNPNTINQIINIGGRANFFETAPNGEQVLTKHILKDGSDSVGITTALQRVFINIGAEGDYWADHLWNPTSGEPQRPFRIDEVRGNVSPERKAELRGQYKNLGDAWHESESRVKSLARYLVSYTPYSLQGAKDAEGKPYLSQDREQLRRGSTIFAEKCAQCHSNDQPAYPATLDADRLTYFRQQVARPGFALGNTFSDDRRYPFNAPGFGVNAARAMATNAIDGDIWSDFSSKDYKALPAIRTVKFTNPLNKLDAARFGGQPIVTEFEAPGGGRGYYRTAALNSMWATAPFLHNNSVGNDPVDAAGKLDPGAVTIAGRLRLFDDAMNQLLSPEAERRLKIKVTSEDCGLLEGMPGVRDRLKVTIRDLAKERFGDLFRQAVGEAIDELNLPEVDASLKPLIKKAVLDLLETIQPELDRIYGKETLDKIKGEAVGAATRIIQAHLAEKLKGRPKLAALVAEVQPKFVAAIQKQMTTLADLLPDDVIVPKGTPVNLILNLNAGRAPYALKFYLKHKRDHRLVAEELLKLSDCPDLVEDRGHTFGSELDAGQKRDLIEFLKTL